MSSHKYNKPLKFDLQPSKFLFVFIILIHFLALSVLTIGLDIPDGILFLLSVLILFNFYRCLQQNSSVRFKTYITHLHCLGEMKWRLVNSDQLSKTALLREEWFSLPGLVILYFKLENNKAKSVIILPDMITKSNLRQLKLFLLLLKS